MSENKGILCPHLILCEGADATYFMIKYIDYLEDINEIGLKEFQAMNFGGNEELSNYLQLLTISRNKEIIKSITIIRDAEKDHIAAVQSIRTTLKNNGFSAPIHPNEIARDDKKKVAFSLFPTLSGQTENGTLEDLYLKNLVESADDLLSDIDIFINGLQSKGRYIPRKHKSRLYTYFAVTDKFTALKLAEAAEAGAFSFDCSEMNCLKSLLKEICSA
ncbi:MAG: hypothetical protein FWF85_05525 [Clostridiales bacterium]|jgi:hypothetical protein|nr:hypothetical protein [Clostridiales bacterium]MDR2713613.1 hypothetical protein [Clostridiales bacterium]